MMATTQAEVADTPNKNGPEVKDLDGQPPSTNGVESQPEVGGPATNGPSSVPNNGAHDMNDSKLQGGYYKPPAPSPYPSDGMVPGYEHGQPGYGYGYNMQHQNSYPYPQQQYPGSDNANRHPGPYMNSMPRTPGVAPPPSPQNYQQPPHQGYSMPQPRYPTPTLNQLLQPGTGAPVQRYPYGEYPQQPNSQAAGWPVQQQPQHPQQQHPVRNYAPSPGFKSPPNSMQQAGPGGYPPYPGGPPPPPPPSGHNVQQQQQQQRYAVSPSGGPGNPPQQHQEATKNSNNSGGVEPSAEASNAGASSQQQQRNSSSPSSSSASSTTPVTTTTTTAASVAATPTSSSAATATAPAGSPAVIPPAQSPASRSLSPALGPPNNNASPGPSGPSENNSGPARMSHSPMAAQGAYQQPMPPPPHVGVQSYKMGGPPYPQPQQPGQPPQSQYLPNPMYMQHPRPPAMGPGGPNPYGPGSYGPPQQPQQQQQPPPAQQQPGGMPPSSVNNPMPPSSPGPNRSMPPHMGPPTPYPGYPPGPPNMNQYGQQQHPNWGPTNPPGSPMQPMHGGGKGGPGQPPTSIAPGGGPRPPAPPQTPPHYMKQHLQHHLQQQQQQKMYGMAPSPGPALPSSQGQQQPPQPGPQQPQQPQHLGPYPPSGNSLPGHPPSAASPVTNLVTTGPDGVAGLDEASQQSTLSNTSAASGDDPSSAPSTPRSRKETGGSLAMTPSAQHHPPFPQQQHHPMQSHPPTPQSTVPSPGAASMSSQHEEYSDVHSPGPVGNWTGVSTRPTPSSPKTTHVSDALARLYDFDDHPDRRKFLDQLLRFMEEKGSPITACPTISKNPLDLFRLYLLVRERGGFLEVTKAKSWKDIAQTLGIGASSSAAYTLRKHYTKHLFPWECKFDRGGVDPQPILNQVEASTKKKPANKQLSVPSPAGSSNSQDSFQSTGVPPAHPPMDGYSNYPGYPPPHTGENISVSNPFDDQQQHYGARGGHPYPGPPPPQQQQQQQPQQQQPPSMYNAMPGRPGYPGHPNQGYHHPYQNDFSAPGSQQYPPYSNPASRTMYSAPYPEPYNPQAPPGGPQAAPPPPGPPSSAPTDPYGRYLPPNHAAGPNAPPAPYPPRPPAPPASAQVSNASTALPPAASPSPATTNAPTAASLPVPPSPLAQPPPQPQQQQGNSSAGPSPAPSPAPNAGGPTYPEQNDQYQRSGLRQLLASSTLAQQLATPSPESRQPNYPGGNVPGSLGPPAGQPYQGLVRPGTPGPAPPGMPSRQSTPTPHGSNQPTAVVPSSGAVPTPPPGGSVQQQQPQQQLAPYQPYGPPGQVPNQQQPRPSYDPYGAYRSPYGTAGPGGDPSSGSNMNNSLATGWRGPAPYGSQYSQQGGSPGPVQAVGAPWVPPTGTPQPRNPAWDQSQRYPGPMTGAQATAYNGTNHQPSPNQAMPPQQQQWSGPGSVANTRPPYPMGPRPPYRPSDGKPYPMPSVPGKGPMNMGAGTSGVASYPPSGMPTGPMGMPIYAAKRETPYFPPDCVEGVTPVMAKRRRLGRADVAPVDAWRLYLALKSGLLAESTWAIDVLNVLLYDDVSVQYFTLAYMPGLMEVLLEHFRRCLSQIFTILEDMEVGFERLEGKMKQRAVEAPSAKKLPNTDVDSDSQSAEETTTKTEDEDDAWWSRPKRKAPPSRLDTADLGSVKPDDLVGERVRFLEGPDWSMSSRRGEKVGVVLRDKELFIIDSRKDWDTHDGFESGMEQWHVGGGETTQHIITHFTAELGIVPFARVLSKMKKDEPDHELQGDDQKGDEAVGAPRDEQSAQGEQDRQAEAPAKANNTCMAKRGRSLLDVLQRIKKEEPANVPSPDEQSTKDQEGPMQTNAEETLADGPLSNVNSTVIKTEPTDGVEGETTPTTSSAVASEEPQETTEAATKEERSTQLVIRDPHGTLKRKKMDDYEDECYTRDESSLYLVDDSQDALSRRALALSNIFRSLSFVPSNEMELARNSTLLVIVGKLLLLHHDHPLRSSHQKNYDREEDADFALVEPVTTCLGGQSGSNRLNESDWWWDTLLALRENVLVLMANIAGQLDLSIYSEEVVRPLIDGLLHWAVCPSAQSQDPFSSFGPCSTSLLSPQRLSLEALCKLLVMEANMDLILATPPFSRLEKLVHFLTRSLCRTEDQVLREFSINLLYYFAAADSGMARLIALHNNSMALLVSFIEQAEANALAVASQHGIQALRENPESMGTSLDMLRRAASTLFHISRHPDSRPLLAKLEQRLLALVMSQIMDQSVAALLSKSLYLCNSDDE